MITTIASSMVILQSFTRSGIPYIRRALFELLKIMEFTTDRETYDAAWKLLQEKFSEQMAILNYPKTYYIDDDEEIVAKWAGHNICKNLNFGLRTTSSTERMHRKLKVQLGHGMGNLLYVLEAAHAAIDDTARDFRREEANQKTAALERFNGERWVGKLHLQVARGALELLAKARHEAERMLRNETPRGECSRSTCRCPTYTQFGLICANRIADKEEAGIPLDKEDVHSAWYLDRDLSNLNLLLVIISPKKILNTKGRPRDSGRFAMGDVSGPPRGNDENYIRNIQRLQVHRNIRTGAAA
jgi:hypothetical protein